MTSNATDDDHAAVKPQVIDLDAEDVTTAPEATEAQTRSVPPRPRPRKAGGTIGWIAVALMLGALAGGWFYRDILSNYLPTDEMAGLKARIETLEGTAKTTGVQLAAVSAAADQASQTAAAASSTVKETVGTIAGLKTGLNDFTARLETLQSDMQSAKSDLEALRGVLASGAASGTGTVDPAALASFAQRLDAIEKDVASLKSGTGSGEQAANLAALSQALSDIKAKIAAGTSYRDELDRISRMVPAAAGLDTLEAHATQGLPTAEGLAAELRAAIPTLPVPESGAASEAGGYLDSVWNALTSIVTIRNIGEADWPAVAEDCATLAASGDLVQAIARIDATEGVVPSAIGQWRERAAARLKLEAALAAMADAVQRQIVSLGGRQ